jgi:hypothetical protein
MTSSPRSPATTTRTACACCAPLSRSPTRASRTSPGRSTGRWPALARAETLKSLAYLPLVTLARAGRPWTSCELHLHCHVCETWPTRGVFERRSDARAYARSVAS